MENLQFETLKGLTLTAVEKFSNNYDRIIFETLCGRTFIMEHIQDCCESVWIEDVVGDLDDLIGNPILVAECVEGEVTYDNWGGDQQYTFYKIDTVKGGVTIRWNGSSNGYYSISVGFYEEK